MKRVWKTWDQFNIHLEYNFGFIPLLCSNDTLLIDHFIDGLASQEELKWLNWCREHLHAVSVADITTADGMAITKEAWTGTRFFSCCPRFHWPRTANPDPRHWNLWRKWLKSALTIGDSRKLHVPLGRWLDWDWVFSPSTDALYHRQGALWRKGTQISDLHHPINRVYLFDPSGWTTESLPPDIQRTSVSVSRPRDPTNPLKATITGVADQVDRTPVRPSPSILRV